MNLVDRAKNMIVQPKDEWPRVVAENATVQSLYVNYILILAAIGPIALLLRTLGGGAAIAIVSYIMNLVVVFIVTWVVDALAPTFGGTKNLVASLKLTAYASTAVWLAAIFQLIPYLGSLLMFIGGLYSLYLFYLGAPVVKGIGTDKAAGFTVLVVICYILLVVALGMLLFSVVLGGSMMGLGAAGLFR